MYQSPFADLLPVMATIPAAPRAEKIEHPEPPSLPDGTNLAMRRVAKVSFITWPSPRYVRVASYLDTSRPLLVGEEEYSVQGQQLILEPLMFATQFNILETDRIILAPESDTTRD